MIQQIKQLGKRILPAPVIRRVRAYRNPVGAADMDAAWRYKREFFWSAFKALDFNGITGDYAEFGCYNGQTFRLAFDQIRQRRWQRHLWAFDSFQGLPAGSSPLDNHPAWKKGSMAIEVDAFHRICASHGISRDCYTVVEGFYEQTLGRMPSHAPPIDLALAYIDCDMYSSTKTVLEFLAPRLKHGMILAFDDYFCWSADQMSGESKALMDVLGGNEKWRLVRYRDYSWAGVSFLVERADLQQ